MHFYNQTGSVVNLALQTLRDLDRSKPETTLPTATVELLLRTLVEIAQPEANTQQVQAGARTMESIRAALRTAGIKDR